MDETEPALIALFQGARFRSRDDRPLRPLVSPVGAQLPESAERNLCVDHVTIWRWVQRYAPELNRRCHPELRKTNGSWRVDERCLRVAGKWTYLYRAVDSTGATIDFSAIGQTECGCRHAVLAENLAVADRHRTRMINVDGNPSYLEVIAELKKTRELERRCRLSSLL